MCFFLCLCCEESDEGDNDSEEHPAIGDVDLDVVTVLPDVCGPQSGDVVVVGPVQHLCLEIGEAQEGDVGHVHREDGDVLLEPLDVSLEELGKVDKDAEEGHGDDVVPGLPVLGRQVEGVADAQEPLDGDCHRHEDGPAEADVGDGVDDEGEADDVGVAAHLK